MIDFSKPIRRKSRPIDKFGNLTVHQQLNEQLIELERFYDVENVSFEDGRFHVRFVGVDTRIAYSPRMLSEQFENVPQPAPSARPSLMSSRIAAHAPSIYVDLSHVEGTIATVAVDQIQAITEHPGGGKCHLHLIGFSLEIYATRDEVIRKIVDGLNGPAPREAVASRR